MDCSAVGKRSLKEEGELVGDAPEDGALHREASDPPGEHAGTRMQVARVIATPDDATQQWRWEVTKEMTMVNN
jgi:hypothetical protein